MSWWLNVCYMSVTMPVLNACGLLLRRLCTQWMLNEILTFFMCWWRLWALALYYQVFCLSFPFLWWWYLKKALREFLKIWWKCPQWINDELMRIWWPKVKVPIASHSCEPHVSRMRQGKFIGSKSMSLRFNVHCLSSIIIGNNPLESTCHYSDIFCFASTFW